MQLYTSSVSGRHASQPMASAEVSETFYQLLKSEGQLSNKEERLASQTRKTEVRSSFDYPPTDASHNTRRVSNTHHARTVSDSHVNPQPHLVSSFASSRPASSRAPSESLPISFQKRRSLTSPISTAGFIPHYQYTGPNPAAYFTAEAPPPPPKDYPRPAPPPPIPTDYGAAVDPASWPVTPTTPTTPAATEERGRSGRPRNRPVKPPPSASKTPYLQFDKNNRPSFAAVRTDAPESPDRTRRRSRSRSIADRIRKSFDSYRRRGSVSSMDSCAGVQIAVTDLSGPVPRIIENPATCRGYKEGRKLIKNDKKRRGSVGGSSVSGSYMKAPSMAGAREAIDERGRDRTADGEKKRLSFLGWKRDSSSRPSEAESSHARTPPTSPPLVQSFSVDGRDYPFARQTNPNTIPRQSPLDYPISKPVSLVATTPPAVTVVDPRPVSFCVTTPTKSTHKAESLASGSTSSSNTSPKYSFREAARNAFRRTSSRSPKEDQRRAALAAGRPAYHTVSCLVAPPIEDHPINRLSVATENEEPLVMGSREIPWSSTQVPQALRVSKTTASLGTATGRNGGVGFNATEIDMHRSRLASGGLEAPQMPLRSTHSHGSLAVRQTGRESEEAFPIPRKSSKRQRSRPSRLSVVSRPVGLVRDIDSAGESDEAGPKTPGDSAGNLSKWGGVRIREESGTPCEEIPAVPTLAVDSVPNKGKGGGVQHVRKVLTLCCQCQTIYDVPGGVGQCRCGHQLQKSCCPGYRAVVWLSERLW